MIVELSARKFAVPYECPCCGASPDTELAVSVTRTGGKEIVRDTARGLDFPYCERCVAHAALWESAGVMSAGVMVLGIVVAVIVALATEFIIGLIAFLAAIPFAWSLAASRRSKAKFVCGPSCASPGKALAYHGWSGTTSSFSFESPTYAARFAEQNTSHLVNISPQLRKLLEGHRIARLAVPTPAAPHLVVPPPATLGEWIARIENSRGTVERRNTLQRALDAVHDPGERKDLLQAASKIELAPFLGKLDELASTGAKKHHLQKAIEAVRADNIPEELQDAELRQLETHVRDLG